jgi:putative DNA primase/helicase
VSFDLLTLLTERTADTAREATIRADQAAPALAFTRTEAENATIVEGVLNRVAAGDRVPALFTAPSFIAAIAALPDSTFDRNFNRLRDLVTATVRFSSRVGWRDLQQRIKAVRAQVSAAREGERAGDGERLQLFGSADFIGMAEAWLQGFQAESLSTLVFYGDSWWRWEAVTGVYNPLSATATAALAYPFMRRVRVATRNGPAPIGTRAETVANLLKAAASLVAEPVRSEQAFWRDESDHERPKLGRSIAFSNCLLDVDSWIAGKPHAVLAHSPALFITKRLDVALDWDAQCPHFRAFVQQIAGDDEEIVRSLQITSGWYLLPDTSLQTIVVFQGPGGTGKGTYMRVLGRILGDQCVSPSLQDLGGNFALQDLLGKTVAILSDIHETGDKVNAAVEKLLRISGQDDVNVQRKFKESLPKQRLPLRILIAINEGISLPDKSGALARRLVLVPFNHIFTGQADDNLGDRLFEEEGAGIVRWFLEGLRLLEHLRVQARVQGKGAVTVIRTAMQPKAGLPHLERLRELGSSVHVFIGECCELGEEHSVRSDQLYAAWRIWSDENGCPRRSKTKFISDVAAATKNAVTVSQVGPANGHRVRTLRGIKLLDAQERIAAFQAYLPGNPS